MKRQKLYMDSIHKTRVLILVFGVVDVGLTPNVDVNFGDD